MTWRISSLPSGSKFGADRLFEVAGRPGLRSHEGTTAGVQQSNGLRWRRDERPSFSNSRAVRCLAATPPKTALFVSGALPSLSTTPPTLSTAPPKRDSGMASRRAASHRSPGTERVAAARAPSLSLRTHRDRVQRSSTLELSRRGRYLGDSVAASPPLVAASPRVTPRTCPNSALISERRRATASR